LGEFHSNAAHPGNARLNELLMKAGDDIGHYACVPSAGLKSLGDNTHFNSAALREFGDRYAAAYLRLGGEPRKDSATPQAPRKK
jgi:hypothetical protein